MEYGNGTAKWNMEMEIRDFFSIVLIPILQLSSVALISVTSSLAITVTSSIASNIAATVSLLPMQMYHNPCVTSSFVITRLPRLLYTFLQPCHSFPYKRITIPTLPSMTSSIVTASTSSITTQAKSYRSFPHNCCQKFLSYFFPNKNSIFRVRCHCILFLRILGP